MPKSVLFGIDPSPVSSDSKSSDYRLISDYFPSDHLDSHSPFDFITACNSFAHIPQLYSAAKSVSQLLSDSGYFIVEVSDIGEMSRLGAWDYIYHEHLFYYSIQSLSILMSSVGLNLHSFDSISTKGGSIRAVFSKLTEFADSLSVKNQDNFLASLSSSYKSDLERISHYLSNRTNGSNIYGYGACATSSVVISQLPGLSSLECIIDDNPLRQNLYSPHFGIPVSALAGLTFYC